MSDRWAVVMAIAAAAGARLAFGAPRAAAVVLVAAALLVRRPAALCAGVLVLASSLSFAARAGLQAPPTYERFTGIATLVGDPERIGFVVRAGVRIDGHRYEAVASGTSAASLFRRLAGEQIEVEGRFGPLTGVNRSVTIAKHYRARLQIERLGAWSSGDPLSRAANRLRRALSIGAASLPPDQRALLSGFVLGDDRAEPAVMIDEFRASGLSHLTAVSGENVAFVLAVAAPLLSRCRLRGRLLATIALLVFFAFVTRFEPSVLRACAMAGLAAWRTYLARPASALRLLALAVTGLLLVDPLLVHSVGFGLSVGASAGIIGLSHRIDARLGRRLPRFVAEPLAVTLAAQIGVLPIGLGLFGPVPVVSIPANLLAAPAAGPVMMWGLTAGLAAGTFARPIAPFLHLPTRLAVGWIAVVARVGARLPLGSWGWSQIALVALGLVVATRRRTLGLALCTAVIVAGAFAARASPVTAAPIGGGARLWIGRHGETVVVAGKAGPETLAMGLRRAHVRRVDVLVVETARDFGPLTARVVVRHLGVVGPDEAAVVEVGDLRVAVGSTG